MLHTVILPLLRAYLRDPDLLRRYNYGRGLEEQPLNDHDRQRIHKARAWVGTLVRRGFTTERLQELIQEIPYVGPYAAFVGYIEMLLSLS